MLKGQTYLDTEFAIGSLVFIGVIFLIIITVLGPLVFVSVTAGSSENGIKALEYANIAKWRLLNLRGDGEGDISYHSMVSDLAAGQVGLGLARNSMFIEDLSTDSQWVFAKGSEKNEHDVFSTMSTPYLPVSEPSAKLMEANGEYMVHIYRIGPHKKDVAVDVYGNEYICGAKGRSANSLGDFVTMGCEEASSAEKGESDAGDLKDIITNFRNTGGDEEYVLLRLLFKSDVTAKDIVPGGMKFGDEWDCPPDSDGDYLCVRRMGDYVLPVRIHVEIANDAGMVSGGGG